MTELASDLIERYMSLDDASSRISLLKHAKAQGLSLPLTFIREMLRYDLIQLEKALLVSCVDRDHGSIEVEDFLTRHLTEWGQETAAAAIRTWSSLPNKILWHRLASLVHIPILPQRLKYTLAETCQHFNPISTITKLIDHGDLAEYSETYHSLLFRRALEYSLQHQKLIDLAKGILNQQQDEPFIKNRTLPFAIAYMARFQPEVLEKYYWMFLGNLSWLDMLRPVLRRDDAKTLNEKINTLLDGQNLSHEVLHEAWPAIHHRHLLSGSTIEKFLDKMLQNQSAKLEAFGLIRCQNLLLGVPKELIENQVLRFKNARELRNFLNLTDGYLVRPLPDQQAKHLEKQLAKEEGHEVLLGLSPSYLALDPQYKAIHDEQKAYLAKPGAIYLKKTNAQDLFISPDSFGPKFLELTEFFNAKNGVSKSPLKKTSEGYYQILREALMNREGRLLSTLAVEARKQTGLNQILYIEALGHFVGMDEAVLKLLDFTRSEKSEELSTLIRSLANINNTRSKQELVHCLTRPNFSHELRSEITAALEELDLSAVQSELRSAINDLKRSGKALDYELALSLTAFLTTDNKPLALSPTQSLPQNGSDNEQVDIDKELNLLIREYSTLSSEVQRALRTAKFFNHYLDRSQETATLDLSPLIDMQYKALELLFREAFENYCFQAIHQGPLQNKLDIIGYARPIPPAMDEFENYISALPVIKDIPFFSKFKLRKMLRAICQYRPGRRFTLDGLKAFALFFLCFSRQQCRYALTNLVPLGFASDTELFEFCKKLHIYQDFRNRAAHEGFHPEVREDIQGIWTSTGEIISIVSQLQKNISKHEEAVKQAAQQKRKEPVIVKKVS